MARATQLIRVVVALIAMVLVVGQAAGDSNPGQAPDELRLNGNTGDKTQPGPVTPSQQISQIEDVDEDAFDEEQQEQQPFRPFRPLSPFESSFLAPFDFFSDSGSNRGPFSLFDKLFDHIDRQAHNFNRQFRDLERLAGEGQDVSYFNRNGVAYVRTCTTKRVSDNDQGKSQPTQLLPFDRSNSRRGQRGQDEQKVPVQLEPTQPQLSQEQQPQLNQDKQSQSQSQSQSQQEQQPQQPAEQAP